MTTILFGIRNGLAVVQNHTGQWQLTTQLQGQEISCLAVDPLQPEQVYAGTVGTGVWQSNDGGQSWQPGDVGLTRSHITAIAVSRTERHGNHGVVYAGTEPSAVYRSDDGGATWRELTPVDTLPSAPTWSYPPRPTTHHVRALVADPVVAGRLFACIENGALIRSFDGGQSWVDRTPDGPKDTHTLQAHPLAQGRLYSAAGDGFVVPGHGYAESHDGGASWSYPDDGLAHQYGWSVAVDPANPEIVLVSCAHGPQQAHNPMGAESAIYRRQGDGPWQQVTNGLPNEEGMLAAFLATNEAEPGVFYAGSNVGLCRSADAGLHWERLPVPWPEHFRFEHLQGLVVKK